MLGFILNAVLNCFIVASVPSKEQWPVFPVTHPCMDTV